MEWRRGVESDDPKLDPYSLDPYSLDLFAVQQNRERT
jgi:hypothetical protein